MTGNRIFKVMTMKRDIISYSYEMTMRIASDIGKNVSCGDIITLRGELGSGKTVFARGIAAGMRIEDDITSPTFSLMEVYEGKITLYHFDLYRIESAVELDQLCFEEYWYGEGVSIIEWPEKAGDRLSGIALSIFIEYIDTNSRRISIEYPDN